ncbi:MAG: hypothetical protein ACFFKA_19445, partial [Candidatus Thorarchaeota archaeon]
MSETVKEVIDSSFDNGIPFWIYSSDYIFGMVPVDSKGNRWKEVSYTFEESDDPLIITERDATLSFRFLLEEVEKGISFYIEDLKIPLIRDFAATLESKPGPEQMKSIIAELINNNTKYSANFP